MFDLKDAVEKASKGAHIIVPPGEHELVGELRLHSDLIIRGEGKATLLITPDAEGKCGFIGKGVTNVTLEGLTIRPKPGNGTLKLSYDDNPPMHGMAHFSDASNIVIKSCVFDGEGRWPFSGILIVNSGKAVLSQNILTVDALLNINNWPRLFGQNFHFLSGSLAVYAYAAFSNAGRFLK